MATVSQAFSIADTHHQANRLREAEQIYKQILEIDPTYADAWHRLGIIAHQMGHYEIAVEHISRALTLKPDAPGVNYNLGFTFQTLGKDQEAILHYRREIEITPNSADSYTNIGVILKGQGKDEEAASYFRCALARDPRFANAHIQLGHVFKDAGQIDDAIASYRRALEGNAHNPAAPYHALGIAYSLSGRIGDAAECYRHALLLSPHDSTILCSLGDLWRAQGKLDEAITCYRQAISIQPQSAAAHLALGLAFHNQGRPQDAAACYRRALELKPDYAEAHNNLSSIYTEQGLLDEAADCCQRALELNPDRAEFQNNYGQILKSQLKFDEATARFRRALELDPNLADAHVNHSDLLLIQGDFERGWPEYEWRWKTQRLPVRTFQQPIWNGQPLQGKTILLHAEQGLGDTIQFIRYAPLVKSFGATVVMECPKPLVNLLKSVSGIDIFATAGDALPHFDVHAPLLSLPAILKTTIDTIPSTVPYVFADSKLINQWRKKLEPLRGFRIGINWHGREDLASAKRRDIPLAEFSPLAQMPGVRLISLQKGSVRKDLVSRWIGFEIFDPGDDIDTVHGGFMDTAAIMMNLDLVITSDTSIPHLAGALGVPVWVGLPALPDWRWLLDRHDSPWYPTMRLFRQRQYGIWTNVIEDIRKNLASLEAAQKK